VGNAVRHAHDRRKIRQILVESTVRGRWRHLLEISVWDVDGIRAPRIPDPATAAMQLLDMPDDAVSGRGLLMVATWSDEIGIDFGGRGKRIWCRWRL
jgi:anti-sigma regulatory factor (Ser/Thr protein kinase)